MNGTSINISGLDASSYDFYLKPDGSGGTDFVVAAAPEVTIALPIAGDNIVNASEASAGFTLQGTASDATPGVDVQTVTVDIFDSSNTLLYGFTPTVDAGAWSLVVPGSDHLADGTYTVTANLTGWAINSSVEATQTFTVDETPPTITISEVNTTNIINAVEAAGNETISGTVSDAGTGVAGVTVEILDSSNNVKDTLSATVTGGTWSANLTTAEATALADGSYTVDATATDVAGNSAITTDSVTVDKTAPTITINAIEGDNSLTAAQAATNFSITGSVTDPDGPSDVTNQTVTVELNGHDYTGQVQASGSWSVTVGATDAQALSNGSYTVTASVSDIAGNTAQTTDTLAVEKLGFSFVPTAATLSALEDGGLVLESGEQIGTFFANGGNSGDNYTLTITGPNGDFTSASAGSNAEALFTNSTLDNVFDFEGSTVYQLTVDVKDATLGQDSGPQPFDVVVDNSFLGFGDSDYMKLTGSNSLGINAATPTIVYGLSGNDAIDATGMTANVWFVGGSGSDTMTGGNGVNTYVFASVSESETPNEAFFGGPTDTITNFDTAEDLIDLAPMNTVTTIQGLLTHSSTNVNADSVAWIVSGSEVIVYANTDPSSAHSQDSNSGFEFGNHSERVQQRRSHGARQ